MPAYALHLGDSSNSGKAQNVETLLCHVVTDCNELQVRVEEMEAQFQAMSTKIKELQDSQRQLEARNAALEVLARTAGASQQAEQQGVSQSP